MSFLLGSCGPSEAPPPVTPAKPVVEAKKPPPIVEDRSPVEAPPGLAVQAHAIGLKTLVRGVKAYLPGNATLDPRALVREVADASLERILDVDKPADLVVQVPEGTGKDAQIPRVAVAFGVEDDLDVANAVKDSYRVEVLPGGVMRLVPVGGNEVRCVVAPALGPARRRLVCGLTGNDPLGLAPWLARGVTRKEPAAAAVRVDVDVTMVKKKYAVEIDKAHAFGRGDLASEVKTGWAELDRVLKGITKNVVDEVFDVIDDLDTLSLEAATPEAGVQLGLTATFAGTKSWVARMMLAGGDNPGPANPRLAKLPGDGVWLAAFSRATPQSDGLIAPIQTALKDVVTALALDFKWPAKDRDLALEVVKLAFPAAVDTAFVSANLGKVELPGGTPKPHGDVARATANAFLSKAWSVSVIERDAKAPTAFVKALFAWAQRPSFADTYRALTKDRLAIKVTTKALAAKDLPKGSWAQRAELELSIPSDDKPAKGKGAKKPTALAKLVTDTIIAPDGPNRTWVGVAQNLGDGELPKVLATALGGAPASPIGSRPGFDFLTQGTPTIGGLFAIDGLTRTALHTRKTEELLTKLPDQGKGAFVFRMTPSKPPKATTEVTALIPRDAIAAVWMFSMH
ncbi:MAG: hypothetical protein HYV09_20350 [Deltaproteobacteria bacterium]|nr:hypothetical protein [Deltaproteobacteria bacterium]